MGLASLVSLAADVGRIGQISEVTHVPEGCTPARHAGAGGLHALSGIPLVTDINPVLVVLKNIKKFKFLKSRLN